MAEQTRDQRWADKLTAKGVDATTISDVLIELAQEDGAEAIKIAAQMQAQLDTPPDDEVPQTA